jgi:cell division protein FtsB
MQIMGNRDLVLSSLHASPAPVADVDQLMRRILLETSEVERLTQVNRDLLANIQLGRADVQTLSRKNKALNQQLELLSSVYEDSLAQLSAGACRSEMRMLA